MACWYAKASDLIQGTNTRCAFVSTNSITQGEQVAPLWRRLNVEIDFAYRTFKWHNVAKGNAAVYCVIIGFHACGERFNTDAGKNAPLPFRMASCSSAVRHEQASSLDGAEPHFKKASQRSISVGENREASEGGSLSHLPPSVLKRGNFKTSRGRRWKRALARAFGVAMQPSLRIAGAILRRISDPTNVGRAGVPPPAADSGSFEIATLI